MADAILGTLMFFFGLVWIVANILRLRRWGKKMARKFGIGNSVDETIDQMYSDHEYAGTRNAAQYLRRK